MRDIQFFRISSRICDIWASPCSKFLLSGTAVKKCHYSHFTDRELDESKWSDFLKVGLRVCSQARDRTQVPKELAKSLATGGVGFFWVVKWVIVDNPELLFFSPLTDLRVFSATSLFSHILYGACSEYLVESQVCLSSPSALFMLPLISHPTSALSLISASLISSSV